MFSNSWIAKDSKVLERIQLSWIQISHNNKKNYTRKNYFASPYRITSGCIEANWKRGPRVIQIKRLWWLSSRQFNLRYRVCVRQPKINENICIVHSFVDFVNDHSNGSYLLSKFYVCASMCHHVCVCVRVCVCCVCVCWVCVCVCVCVCVYVVCVCECAYVWYSIYMSQWGTQLLRIFWPRINWAI